jgi:hypothetical protein
MLSAQPMVEIINKHGLYWTEIQEPSADSLHENHEQCHFHRLNLGI